MTNDKKVLSRSKLSPKSETNSVSVGKMREELQNVIEKMGPNSPMLNESIDDTSCSVCLSSVYTPPSSQYIENISTDEQNLRAQLDETDTDSVTETEVQVTNPVWNKTANPADGYPAYYKYEKDIKPHVNADYVVPHRPSRISRFINVVHGFVNDRYPTKNRETSDLYRIQIQQDPDNGSPPRKLIFNLIDDFPRAETKTVATSTQAKERKYFVPHHQNLCRFERDENPNPLKAKPATSNTETKKTRDELYYFDHGNAEYLQTTDSPKATKFEYAVESTDKYTTYFWAQCFSLVHVGVAFVMSFFIQLIRFLLQAIVRPFFIGVLQMVADYFVKPFLTALFNGVIQPLLICMFNVTTSVRDMFRPLADCFGYFVREIAVMCKATRLVQMEKNYFHKPMKEEQAPPTPP